jgi:hypothetical protein
MSLDHPDPDVVEDGEYPAVLCPVLFQQVPESRGVTLAFLFYGGKPLPVSAARK